MIAITVTGTRYMEQAVDDPFWGAGGASGQMGFELDFDGRVRLLKEEEEVSSQGPACAVTQRHQRAQCV